MSNKFPHIGDTNFPNLQTVNTYAYKNTFDYTKWEVNTTIKLLNVSWDSDYENVVEFDTVQSRDEYIKKNTRETYTFETEQYLQPDGSIKVPVPFDVCQRYNYISVNFPKAPIQYGSDDPRISDMFFFVMGATRLSPNTTELQLSLDYWQTYLKDFKISYMQLTRGHAPMEAAPTPEAYLENPLSNNALLLSPDVNYGGTGERIKVISNKVFNEGVMWVVLAMSSDPFTDDWGTIDTDTMHIPGLPVKNETGISNYEYIAIQASFFGDWLSGVLTNKPYVLEAVVSTFYCTGHLLTFADAQQQYGVNVFKVRAGKNIDKNFIKLTKQDFGYNELYDKITKLYTSPYARIEVSTDDGSKMNVNIEDVSSSVGFYASLNLVSGSVGIDCHLLQINNTGDNYVQFNNNGTNLRFNASAGWQNFMMHWNIPQFAIFSDQQTYQRWRRYWKNRQSVLSYEATYANAVDGANNENVNNETSINSQKITQLSNESLTINNMQLSARRAWLSQSNAWVTQKKAFDNEADINAVQMVPQMIGAVAGGPAGAASFAGTAYSSTVAFTQKVDFALDKASIDADALRQEFGDAVGDAVHVDTIANAMSDFSSTSISPKKDNGIFQEEAYYVRENQRANLEISYKSTNVSTNNSIAITLGGNQQKLDITNRIVETGVVLYGSANRARDLSISAINTGNHDAELAPSKMTGTFGDCGSVITKPIGMFGTLVTQSDNAIASAGDEMLRYGYYLNQHWIISNLQVMKHFTYWQASDLWLSTSKEITQDANTILKNIFKQGVTVWSDPDKIEEISLFDNWK